MTSDDAIMAAFYLYVQGFLRRGWCAKRNNKKQPGAGENLRVFTVHGTIAKIQRTAQLLPDPGTWADFRGRNRTYSASDDLVRNVRKAGNMFRIGETSPHRPITLFSRPPNRLL